MLTPGLQLGTGLQPTNPIPTDSWAGPYASIAEANATVPSAVRFEGREVIIWDGIRAKIYGWYVGIGDGDLEEQSSGGSATPGEGMGLDGNGYIALGSDFGDIIPITSFRYVGIAPAAAVHFTTDDGNGILSIINDGTVTGVQIQASDVTGGINYFSLLLDYGNGATFIDNRPTQIGIVYNADYSATFTARSLVDKDYVDNAVAGGGGSAWGDMGEDKFLYDSTAGDTTSYSMVFGANDLISYNDDNFDNALRRFSVQVNNSSITSEGSFIGLKTFDYFFGEGIYRETESHAAQDQMRLTAARIGEFYYQNDIFDQGDRTTITIGESGFQLTKSRWDGTTLDGRVSFFGNQGFQYAADYSANYTNRSLVDKEYVDNATGGGWPLSGAAALIGDVTMDLATFSLNFTGVSNLGINAALTDDTADITTTFGLSPSNGILLLRQTVAAPSTLRIEFDDQNINIESSTDSDGSGSVRIENGNGAPAPGVYLQAFDLTNVFNINLTATLATIESTYATFVGLQYAADYSANFTARSLVDKGYVDNVVIGGGLFIFESGLTNTAGTVRLGGTLTQAASITGDFAFEVLLGAGEAVYLASNDTLIEGAFYASTDGVSMSIQDLTSTFNTEINVAVNQMLFTGSDPTFAGATYNADYSANYTARSLVDKAYADIAGWALTGTSILTGDVIIDGITNAASMILSGTYAYIASEDSIEDADNYSYVYVGGTGAARSLELAVGFSGEFTTVNITPTTAVIGSSAAAFEGLKYQADYSTNFVARSLVDKAYVDNVVIGGGLFIFDSGLTNTAGTITLGGNINQNTNIDGAFDFRYGNTVRLANFSAAVSGDISFSVYDGIATNQSQINITPSTLLIDSGDGDVKIYSAGAGNIEIGEYGATTIRSNSGAIVLRTNSSSMIFMLDSNGETDPRTTFTDARPTTYGIEYAADYSADFGPRSLVDKAYVDASAGTGWPLGGTANLIGAGTTIRGDGDTAGIRLGESGFSLETFRVFTNNFQINSAGNFTFADQADSHTSLTINPSGAITINPFTNLIVSLGGDTGTAGYVLTADGAGNVTWAAGGGGAGSASNGLHVDGGDIKLGGELIEDTDVYGNFRMRFGVTAGLLEFNVKMEDANDGGVILDNTEYRVEFNDNTASQSTLLVMNGVGGGFLYKDGATSGLMAISGSFDGSGLSGNPGVELYYINKAAGTGGYFALGVQTIVGGELDNFEGIQYAEDYSANYTNRSLVDKEYVDNAVAGGGGGGGHIIQDSGTPLAQRANLNFTNGLIAQDDAGNDASLVKLGGNLMENTTIVATGFDFAIEGANHVSIDSSDGTNTADFDLFPTQAGLNADNGADNNGSFSVTPFSSQIRVEDTNTGANAQMLLNTEIDLSATDGTNDATFRVSPGEILVESFTASFAGIQYAADYSANFTARSLVDKEYVDNVVIGGGLFIFESGLTNTAGTVRLGGVLLADAVIDGNDTYSLALQDLTALTISGQVASFAGAVYADDYSANYTNRSLVDKEYVDIAPIAWRLQGTSTLTADVSIDGAGFAFDFTSEGPDSAFTFHANDGVAENGVILNSTGFGIEVVNATHSSTFDINNPDGLLYTQTAGANTAEFAVGDYGGATPTISMSVADAAGNTRFEMATDGGHGIVVTSSYASFVGIQYADDYSPNFIARSLVDKAYVDNVVIGGGLFVFESGLTNTAGTVRLGGVLLEDLVIDGASTYSVSWENPTSFGVTTAAGGIGLGDINGGEQVTVNIQTTVGGLSIIDERTTPTGMEYAADYAANYTDRSLVDKQYVDDAIAAAGSGWPLGGSAFLTGHVQIQDPGTGTYQVSLNNVFSFQANSANASGDSAFVSVSSHPTFGSSFGISASTNTGDGFGISFNQSTGFGDIQSFYGNDLHTRFRFSQNLASLNAQFAGTVIKIGYNVDQGTDPATWITIGANEMLVTSFAPTFAGIVYNDDYSANYTARSLVDRDWVLSQISDGSIPPPQNDDKDLTPTVTSGDEASTGLTIANTPTGLLIVIVDGVVFRVGDGVKTKDCYFSDDAGATAKTLATIVAGDELYWNGVIAGADLAVTNSIDFYYI